jgi:hypothetical protein
VHIRSWFVVHGPRRPIRAAENGLEISEPGLSIVAQCCGHSFFSPTTHKVGNERPAGWAGLGWDSPDVFETNLFSDDVTRSHVAVFIVADGWDVDDASGKSENARLVVDRRKAPRHVFC